MSQREQEYRWYLTGCQRMGYDPLPEAEFVARWQEFEDYAEKLKVAEAGGKPPDVEPAVRAEMERRMKEDPFVKAVLVGMAEDPSAG